MLATFCETGERSGSFPGGSDILWARVNTSSDFDSSELIKNPITDSHK